MNLKKTKEVEKLQFVELMRYKKHIRIINKAGGFITRLSAVFYASKGYALDEKVYERVVHPEKELDYDYAAGEERVA